MWYDDEFAGKHQIEDGESALDYMERLAIESGYMRAEDALRKRNIERYQGRQPGSDDDLPVRDMPKVRLPYRDSDE